MALELYRKKQEEILGNKEIPVLTEWIDAGPLQISATTTAPIKGPTSVDRVLMRRVGDSLEIRYEYKQISAGVAGLGDYLFGIPTTFQGQPIQIDLSKVTPYTTIEGPGIYNNVGGIVGQFSYTDSPAGSQNNFYGDVIVYDSNYVRLGMRGGSTTSTSIGIIGSAYGQLSVPTLGYATTFKVPIQGWLPTAKIKDL